MGEFSNGGGARGHRADLAAPLPVPGPITGKAALGRVA